MKKLIYICIVLILTNCSDLKKNSNDEIQVLNNSVKNDTVLTILDNEKLDSNICSREILLKTEKNIDNLDLELVTDFLSTFHESCKNNVEYSEWSNELLFKLINRKPEMFLEIISNNSTLSREYLLDELTSPLHDQIDLNHTIDLINRIDISNNEEWKFRIIESLEIAKKGN